MTKRPLCFLCLIFLIIQGMILIIRGGQSLVEMPASSIFWEPEGQEVVVTGQVYQKRLTKNTQILFLKNNSISNQENYLIYDSDFHNISIGQTVQIKGTISHFERARNPGNFDQALYYAKEEIYGAIFCKDVMQIYGEASCIKEELYRLKCAWKNMLIEKMGEEQGNVLAAMLLGEKSEMDADVKEIYQKSGIGHILAISGLHISFVGLGIYQCLRKLRVPYGVAGVLAVGILSLYACMIGVSISVFRAYVMLFLKILADVTGRVYDMLTALMLSAALSVWKQPLYLTDAGFYLSYGAVLGLVLFMPLFKGNFMKPLVPGLCVHLALFPIQLWYYNEFPLYSILLNLFVIPLMSVVLTLGIVGSVIGFVLPLCKWILLFYEKISELSMQFPFSRIITGRPEIWELVIYYVFVGLILLNVIKRKSIKSIGFIFSVFLLVYSPAKDLQITMLDVGQGDCLFVRGPTGVTYLIDGGSSDVKEVGKYRMESYLKYEGVRCLDYVFVSHGDGDHYSGIMEMLSRQDVGVAIRKLVLPENYKDDSNLMRLALVAKENKSDILVIKENVALRERGLTITCLQPSITNRFSGNEGSMVLDISYGEFDMLCTGDVEAQGEKLLTNKVKGKEYDVLKVAHHGSKYSTEEEFLDAIGVKNALISAGKNNKYGHPHKETLKRLKEEKCDIYQTTDSGAITIWTDGDFIDIFTTSI